MNSSIYDKINEAQKNDNKLKLNRSSLQNYTQNKMYYNNLGVAHSPGLQSSMQYQSKTLG